MSEKSFYKNSAEFPEGFRGWGGEDNGWTHKVRLLGKAGRTNSRQTVFHLYHALSGGNGGNAHILANPHYEKNWDYLTKIRKTSDAESFLKEFPPEKMQLWDRFAKNLFRGGKRCR